MKIKHLGLIPDGNRRWAKEHGMTKRAAYDLFSDHICNIILAVNELGIEMLTVYVVSKENLARNNQDIEDVMQSVSIMLDQKLPPIVKNLHVQIRCIGIDVIDNKEFIKTARKIEEDSHSNNGMIVNLLIGYNPIDEINKIVSQGQKVCINNLSIPKSVDLLIRTAGRPIRLSNFLPLQCGYANIEVLESKFLDTSCESIKAIIDKYQEIEPNYGK